MPEKWILTINDKETTLAAILASLQQLGQEYHLVPATTIQAALEQIEQRPFDLVITDLPGSDRNGIRYLELIQRLRPGLRVLVTEENDYPGVKAESSRLKIYRYLIDPLVAGSFLQTVKEAVGGSSETQGKLSILGEEDYQNLSHILELLQKDTGARCVLLTDGEGTIIAHTGYFESLAVSRLSFLLSGSIASLAEAGSAIDHTTSAINLAYREGKSEELYAINLGSKFLLIILIDRGPFSSRLGLVWYHARLAATSLLERLNNAKYTSPGNIFGDNIEQALNGEFDKLFPADRSAQAVPKSTPTAPAPEDPSKGVRDTPQSTLSFDEAVRSGVIQRPSKDGPPTPK